MAESKIIKLAYRDASEQKRAPFIGALFYICLIGLTTASFSTQAFWWNSKNDDKHDSQEDRQGERVKVKYVIDGDTFTTRSGDKVRMLGINTPELFHGKQPDEPMAKIARKTLQGLIGNRSVTLQFAKEKRDRHGRLIAFVETSDGKDAQLELLKTGLAFAVVVGEAHDRVDEYLAAEKAAREAEMGVWGSNYFNPTTIDRGIPDGRGYQRVIGTIKRVDRSRSKFGLWFTDRFRILVDRRVWNREFAGKPQSWVGKRVEARGWVFKSKGTGGINVYHPSMLEALER